MPEDKKIEISRQKGPDKIKSLLTLEQKNVIIPSSYCYFYAHLNLGFVKNVENLYLR